MTSTSFRHRLMLTLSAFALAHAHAQFPVEDMDRRSLGLGYTFSMRGQDITNAEVASHEVIHRVDLGYSPIPYVSLSAGIGIDRFSVAPYQQTRFRGGYGFTPYLGASFFSPAFAAEMLKGTVGAGAYLMNSEDDRGFRYSAFMANPFLGLIFSPSVFLNAALGGRLHLVEGTMHTPRSVNDAVFANNEIFRGYLALTVKTPFERAFVSFDADFSTGLDLDWSAGPQEASLAVTFGTFLGWRGKAREKTGDERPKYFPAYPEMKDKQEEMAKELE